ncbi:hypothetical protein [Caballeronia choica]|nr:hypothetical protein [Caballeronia choica]
MPTNGLQLKSAYLDGTTHVVMPPGHAHRTGKPPFLGARGQRF